MKLTIGFLLFVLTASAQRPTFEVASVKPSTGLGLRPRRTGETVFWPGATLGFLIKYAYDVAAYQITGALPPQPGKSYDIEAKVPPATTEEQVKLMFQSLLEDRFALKLKRETQDMSALELVPDPKGHRLKPTQEGVQIIKPPLREGMAGVFLEIEGRHLAGKAATITQLLDALSVAVNQPVVDRTGLTGLFDFDVLFGPEDAPFNAAPPVRTALQDTLGLRLRKGTAAIPIVVVESVGSPSEN